MPTLTAQSYRSCLPQYNKNDFWSVICKVGAIVTIVLPLITLAVRPQLFNEYIYSLYIVFLSFSITCYLVLIERRKLQRYAQTVFFTHYVNHAVRDILTEQRRVMSPSFDATVLSSYFLDTIRTCFSIVTGKHCRVCIKELKPDQTIFTIARDTMSDKIGSTDRTSAAVHNLSENSDFSNLWYWKPGNSRFFLSLNLPKLFSEGNYNNSSFKDVGIPEIEKLPLGGKIVTKWNLPYKSTLVVPIRYISNEAMASTGPKRESAQHYWGFLCIDCDSRGVFDPVLCPELGAVFADALYTLFSQLAHMKDSFRELEEATRPGKP